MSDVSRVFLDDSRAFLTRAYMPKIERCVSRLTEEQIWFRGDEASNSIGHLLLHLTGSTRYWAIEVIGGSSIGRIRQAEFDPPALVSRDRLMADLRAVVEEVDQLLAQMSAVVLLDERTARKERCTVLWCVYHIVEHFSMHTGQIISMTKALVGDLSQESLGITGQEASS
ncbi:MAG TPA: DinB family protein [Candidatus Eisenbacteria bacterium]|nr:DinB family protein [Candidatus Eisenbacteria bacterium]